MDPLSGTKNIKASKGDWVEIWNIILPGGERAPQVPSDTQKIPLEMRLRGFLINESAQTGEDVWISTRIGRKVKGRLVQVNPGYAHTFGLPQKELLIIGQELRKLLGIGGGINGD